MESIGRLHLVARGLKFKDTCQGECLEMPLRKIFLKIHQNGKTVGDTIKGERSKTQRAFKMTRICNGKCYSNPKNAGVICILFQ